MEMRPPEVTATSKKNRKESNISALHDAKEHCAVSSSESSLR